jgi:hypothetical protein
MVADQRGLMDALGGYLFHDEGGRRRIDGHLCLGISLGGHSVWQTLFAEERMRAGVVVIGCPDFECEFLILCFIPVFEDGTGSSWLASLKS